MQFYFVMVYTFFIGVCISHNYVPESVQSDLNVFW